MTDMSRFEYEEDWEEEILTCSECNWKGTFREGDTEMYAEVMDSSCPNCDIILAVMSYPTTAEAAGYGDEVVDLTHINMDADPVNADWIRHAAEARRQYTNCRPSLPRSIARLPRKTRCLKTQDPVASADAPNPQLIVDLEGHSPENKRLV